MKSRADFVTNSSSSSYIIAYQDIPEIDSETIAKYPMLANFKQLMNLILFSASDYLDTTKGVKYTSKEDVLNIFLSDWGYDTIEEVIESGEDYLVKQIEKCFEAIDNGYTILMKDVDYSDDTIRRIFRTLGEIDTGIKVISSD